jgi:hypothetical protein
MLESTRLLLTVTVELAGCFDVGRDAQQSFTFPSVQLRSY